MLSNVRNAWTRLVPTCSLPWTTLRCFLLIAWDSVISKKDYIHIRDISTSAADRQCCFCRSSGSGWWWWEGVTPWPLEKTTPSFYNNWCEEMWHQSSAELPQYASSYCHSQSWGMTFMIAGFFNRKTEAPTNLRSSWECPYAIPETGNGDKFPCSWHTLFTSFKNFLNSL